VVLSNSWVEHTFSATVVLAGAAGAQTFSGFAFGPAQNNVSLGKVASQRGSDGRFFFNATLQPLQVQFWVEDV